MNIIYKRCFKLNAQIEKFVKKEIDEKLQGYILGKISIKQTIGDFLIYVFHNIVF